MERPSNASNISLDSEQLTKNCDSPYRHNLRNRDGRVGGILGNGEWFITTPNAEVLYEPPVGNQRKVVIRKNHLYAADDPLLWPQFHCDKATHFACIPLKPDENLHPRYFRHIVMFDFSKLESWQLRSDGNQNSELQKFRVDRVTLDNLAHSITYLKIRTTDSPPDRDALQPDGRRTYIDQQLKLMDASLTYLRTSEGEVEELNRHVIEIKRAWIYSISWLDYMTIYRRKFDPERAPSSMLHHCMGCFTTSTATVACARSAGLPVWLIQPSSSFSDQVILKTADVLRIDEQLQCDQNSLSNMVFRGRNGDIKLYENLQLASRNFVWSDAPIAAAVDPPLIPFDAQPDVDEDVTMEPTTTCSNSTSGTLTERARKSALHTTVGHPYVLPKERPVLRWSSKKSADLIQPANNGSLEPPTPPQESKDHAIAVFQDLEGPFAPNTIPAFATANLTINRESPAFVARKKKFQNFVPTGYGFPPPHIIAGAAEDRANIYSTAWVHLRDALIHTTENHMTQLTVLSTSDWRELLGFGLLGAEYWTRAPPAKKKHLTAFNHKKELRQFAQYAIDYTRQMCPRYDAPSDVHPFQSGTRNLDPLTVECGDETLYLLSVLNFRFDVIMLDMYFTTGYIPGIRTRPPAPVAGSLDCSRLEKRRIYLYDRLWYTSFDDRRGGLFAFKPLEPNHDWANPDWNTRYVYVKALAELIRDWPIAKPHGFAGRCEALQLIGDGFQKARHFTLEDARNVEREIICLFCQAFYDVFGRPPVLHYKSKFVPDMPPRQFEYTRPDGTKYQA